MIGGVATNSQACPAGEFGATGGGHPHCVVLGNDGNVYVCDRPNSRIQVFDRSCGAPSTTSAPEPLCLPKKIINIGLNAGQTPPANSFGNNAFQNADEGAQGAILASLTTRACDIDFWPNEDDLATKSPTSQKIIVDVDLGNDNTWLIDRATSTVLGALGVCGILPCPGHNAGHFAYGHTTAVDSQGNIYVAETITGRRIQKFVPVQNGDQNGNQR
jgi:DNA-binding beta-propeller fold protein YncE